MRCDDCGKKPGTADAMPGLRSQALLFSTTAHAISRTRVSLVPVIAAAGLCGELFCARLAAAADRGGGRRAAGGGRGTGAIVPRHCICGLVNRGALGGCGLGGRGGALTATIRRQCVSRSCVPSRAAVTTRPAVVSRSVIMDARVEHFPLT